MRVYVASSWRNHYQAQAVDQLRTDGHEVYDFKDSDGFSWKEVRQDDPREWGFPGWRAALQHPAAERGFARDMAALTTAHACVLVLPCGRSAHLELGWAIGQRLFTAVWCPVYDEPDLMVKAADLLTDSLDAVSEFLAVS